jgi:hypothetical protein
MFVDVIVHLRPRTPNMGNPIYGLLTSEQPMLTVHVERRAPRSKEDTYLGGKTGPGHDAVPSSRLAERGVFDPNIRFCRMKHK